MFRIWLPSPSDSIAVVQGSIDRPIWFCIRLVPHIKQTDKSTRQQEVLGTGAPWRARAGPGEEQGMHLCELPARKQASKLCEGVDSYGIKNWPKKAKGQKCCKSEFFPPLESQLPDTEQPLPWSTPSAYCFTAGKWQKESIRGRSRDENRSWGMADTTQCNLSVFEGQGYMDPVCLAYELTKEGERLVCCLTLWDLLALQPVLYVQRYGQLHLLLSLCLRVPSLPVHQST